MALSFLKESPDYTLRKIKSDLFYIDPRINLDVYQKMTVRGLNRELHVIESRMSERRQTSTYGSWIRDERHVRDGMIVEAIKVMIRQKNALRETQSLVPNSIYYRGVKTKGDMLVGQRAFYTGAKVVGWMPFRESTAVAKARLILRHGTTEDFRNIYVGLSDGRPDALTETSFRHVAESSRSALKQIESYCDTRWDGPWPWETAAPEKLKEMIEDREDNKMNNIEQMKRRMARILREFEEGTMNQYEMVAAAQEMTDKVDSIISDLGKLSSTGIEVMAQAKAGGDENSIEPMQSALGEPLNNAVSALTDLKAALASAINQLTGQGGDMGGAGGMDDMGGDVLGSPADAMGSNPMGSDTDTLTDVEFGGDEDERPRKEI